jgi:SpoVK/Ycf46/Vps4 family AAA+-type ATPase
LRALEFYDGILFLTTNRIGSFDDAFTSRVHIQLYYPNLDDHQRNEIWKIFINKLAKERGDTIRLNIDAKDYIRGKEIQALELNGREIRNSKLAGYPFSRFEEKI